MKFNQAKDVINFYFTKFVECKFNQYIYSKFKNQSHGK